MLRKMSVFAKNICPEDLSNLDFDGKKHKWRNDYKQLQIFIQDRLGIKRKWSCPGGSSKRFKAKEGEFILNYSISRSSQVCYSKALKE